MSQKPPQPNMSGAPGSDDDTPPPRDVSLKHSFNYVGGAMAFKNSSKRKKMLNPENLRETIMFTDFGRARKVTTKIIETDPRAGNYPQHNSPEDFKDTLELIPSRNLEPYMPMVAVNTLENSAFTESLGAVTKARLRTFQAQFSHLSQFAFNEMMDITSPDKRDYVIWFKRMLKHRQVVVAYPHRRTGLTIFSQVIQYNDEGAVLGIKHCSYDQGRPLVVNESCIDSYGNIRQIAHLGAKGDNAAAAYNSVERFDDGTVVWTITQDRVTGSAALRPDGEIVFVQGQMNAAAKLAAQNLGAEDVMNDEWVSGFSLYACKPTEEPMQIAFKNKMRKQIGQIIDGATIPGLDPIFRVPLVSDVLGAESP